MEVTMFEIDPVKYGVLWQKVESYEEKFDDMSKKMDKMEANIEKLLENQAHQKGASWLAIGILTSLSTLGGWAVHWLTNK
jgi:response regulator of citrate/malate metabolism